MIQWLIVIALIALLVGAVVCLVFWSMYQGAKARADASAAREYELTKALAELQGARIEERDRMEKVIALLKHDLQQLEEDLNACRDPGAVRARLQRVLRATLPGNDTDPP